MDYTMKFSAVCYKNMENLARFFCGVGVIREGANPAISNTSGLEENYSKIEFRIMQLIP